MRPPAATTALGIERLSDEERITRVANAVQRSSVHRLPTKSSRRVSRLRLQTEDGRVRATLYRSGRRMWSSPIGVGKKGTPTPAGRLWIRQPLRNFGGAGVYGR